MNKGGLSDPNSNIKLSPVRRRRHSGTSAASSTTSKPSLEKETRQSAKEGGQRSQNMSKDSEFESFDFINATDLNDGDRSSMSDTSAGPNANGSTVDSSSIQMTTFVSPNDSEDDGNFDEGALLISKESQPGQVDGNKSKLFDEAETKVLVQESFWSISVQVFIPFLIAGMGMVGAGLVLDIVQHWPVFVKVPEVFILVPALLGLKGNLEMTLASRLSTQANLGNLDSAKSKWQMTLGNLSLVQCQAIVIGFLASVAAVILSWLIDGHFDMDHALILCTSSVMTASIASFCLGVIMVTVVLVSRYLKINPDNVATPIAASLGDLTTLSLLAGISNGIHGAIENHPWVAPVILGVYLVSISLWIHLAKQNSLTEKVLYTGWTPVLSAMVISSCGGLILDYTVKTFKGIAVFQPVISGVGGNLVAVQASRISTYLHFHCQLGTLPDNLPGVCINPIGTFFNKGGHAMTARALVLMVIPGHLIFAYTISYIQAGHTSITSVFLLFYLIAALLQVIILLYIAEILILCLWKNSIDPDNSAIPYLTAICDLVGTSFLAIAFLLLYWVGDRDSDVGD